MSKRYIIEIAEEPYTNGEANSAKLYRAVGFNSLVFDQNGLDKLVPFEKARPSWMDEEYQRGLNNAWKAAWKIVLPPDDGGYSVSELRECFGEDRLKEIIKKFTAEEAIEKIREYEERPVQEDAEIKVGDEVGHYLLNRLVVATHVEGNSAYGIISNGVRKGQPYKITDLKKDWIKTGRHVDLAEIFGGEDE